MKLKQLLEKKAAIYADMQDLKRRLEDQKYEWTTDDQARYDAADADMSETLKKIEMLERMNQLSSEAPDFNPATGQEPKKTIQERYQEVYEKYIRRGRLSDNEWEVMEGNFREYQERGTATITTATSGLQGGYLLPITVLNDLHQIMLEYGGMMQVSRIIETPDGGTLYWPTNNDTSAMADVVTEGNAVTVQDTSFDRVTFSHYTYADLIKLSRQFLSYEGVNILGELSNIIATRFGRRLNLDFTTGNGSGRATGFVTSASTGKTGASTTTFTIEEIIDLQHSVDPAYRRNARFMMNDATLAVLRKLSVGSADDRPLWMPSFVAGSPDLLLGDPYTINQDMADLGAAAKPIAYGDFSHYIIRRVKGMSMQRLVERYAETLTDAFVAWADYDGKLLDTSAIKVFANAAS